MTRTTHIGSLCTGYGGLDIAVMDMFGGPLAWCADNDRHVATVLAARYPTVPNLGDITALDWSTVPPIDILCAGFPCQDISYAGKGAGINGGTRSGIWINIVEGIRQLAPKIVVVENVAAIRRRGLGRILGDLAALGYDANWTSLRASDVGSAHRRERVFVLAYRPENRDAIAAAHARSQRRPRWPARRGPPSWWPPSRPERSSRHGVPERSALADTASQRWHQGVGTSAKQSRGTTSAGDHYAYRHDGRPAPTKTAWGIYESAIRRWEAITGQPAPYPTEAGTRGQPRLAPALSEWLMGLPAGFITDLGLPYYAQLQVIGNGVVPQQATAALYQLARHVARCTTPTTRQISNQTRRRHMERENANDERRPDPEQRPQQLASDQIAEQGGPETFADAYERAMRAGEREYRPALAILSDMGLSAAFTQTGGMCAAIEVTLQDGCYLLVTDVEGSLPWEWDDHQDWAVGLYRPPQSDDEDTTEALRYLMTDDGSLEGLAGLIGEVLGEQMRRSE